MILVDYSQICLANLHQQLKGSGGILAPDLLRHMALNSIRRVNREFGAKYGRIVICTDNQNYWRKTFFRNYKANRKKTRDASEIDWKVVFETLHQLRDELRETFPYKVMNVPFAEADDVIAVLTRTFKSQEPILIVSSDKDFIQLLDENVAIYRPIKDELLLFKSAQAATQLTDVVSPCSDLLSDLLAE